jgi:CubicO group peptidase (beta-lactamase class C family)
VNPTTVDGPTGIDTDRVGHEVDLVFQDWHGNTHPGGWAAVMHGSQTLCRAYGTPSIEHGLHWRRDSRLRVFGVTMSFVAAAVLMLADASKLALDDDVRRWLPDLPDYGRRVTLSHLLDHSSGVRDNETLAFLAGFVQFSPWSTEYAIELIKRQRQLNFEPGSATHYSNSNYRLLALVIERASGIPFEDFLRTRLFEPLGMHDSLVVPVDGPIVPHLASGYLRTDAGAYVGSRVASVTTGDGGAISTVDDLLTWLRAVMADRVPGVHDLVARTTATRVLADGRAARYGLGVRVGVQQQQRYFGHGGEHHGYGCEYLCFPDLRLAVVVCANYFDARLEPRAHALAALALQAAGQPALPDSAANAAWPQRDAHVGWFADASLPLVVKVRRAQGLDYGVDLVVSASVSGLAREDRHGYRCVAGYDSLAARFVDRPGRRPQLRLWLSGRWRDFEPVAPEFLAEDRMHEYCGLYGSAELNAVHRVYVRDGRLLHLRGLGEWPAEQVRELVRVGDDLFVLDYPDRLGDLFTTVQFERNRAGKVKRLTVANRDVSGIAMDRLPESVDTMSRRGAGSVRQPLA